MASRKYPLRFSELAQQHFFGEGALSDSAVLARWDARVNEVSPMTIAESARWGDLKSDPARTQRDWRRAVDFSREQFFPSRTSIVIQQLKQASVGNLDAQVIPWWKHLYMEKFSLPV